VNDPWSFLDVGVWIVFLAWGIAIHLCQGDIA
jgi:hypothetical protein